MKQTKSTMTSTPPPLQSTATTKSPSEFVLNRDRALEVLTRLYDSYLKARHLFCHVDRHLHAPQRRYIPKGMKEGSLEHQRWLFFAVATDRREQSELVYQSHVRLAETRPVLYTAASARLESRIIEEYLSEEKVGSPGQSAQHWPRIASCLFGEFKGFPLRLYEQHRLINDMLAFKQQGKDGDKLPGFGPKILSLLSLFYEELELIKAPVDAFPVDVHVQRFAISTGIVTGTGDLVNSKSEQALRPFLCSIVMEQGWSSLELSHAIWFLGNRVCTDCYRLKAARQLCPAYDLCGGSISTRSYYKKGLWHLEAPRHRKGGSTEFSLPAASPLFTG